MKSTTFALLNCNDRDDNQYGLEYHLGDCAKEKGAYVISLFACDRVPMPEEGKRGGIDPDKWIYDEAGQHMIIHA